MLVRFQQHRLRPPELLLILSKSIVTKQGAYLAPFHGIDLLQLFCPDAFSPTEFAVRNTLWPGTAVHKRVELHQSLGEPRPEVPEQPKQLPHRFKGAA